MDINISGIVTDIIIALIVSVPPILVVMLITRFYGKWFTRRSVMVCAIFPCLMLWDLIPGFLEFAYLCRTHGGSHLVKPYKRVGANFVALNTGLGICGPACILNIATNDISIAYPINTYQLEKLAELYGVQKHQNEGTYAVFSLDKMSGPNCIPNLQSSLERVIGNRSELLQSVITLLEGKDFCLSIELTSQPNASVLFVRGKNRVSGYAQNEFRFETTNRNDVSAILDAETNEPIAIDETFYWLGPWFWKETTVGASYYASRCPSPDGIISNSEDDFLEMTNLIVAQN